MTLKCLTFSNLYRDILSKIRFEVSLYSTNFSKKQYVSVGKKFSDALKNMAERFILRAYTLNYDNMLLEIPGMPSFFTGLKDNSDRFNYTRIIQEDTIDCFYNLHGSIFYKSRMIDPEIGYELVYSNRSNSTVTIDFPRNLLKFPMLPYTMLTGNQKLAKTLLEPMNAFNHSFRRDFLKASCLLAIGYSFNDPHINNCIYSSLKANPELKLFIVTKYNPNNKVQLENELTRALSLEPDIILENDSQSNWLCDKTYTINCHIGGLEQFLDTTDNTFLFEKIRS